MAHPLKLLDNMCKYEMERSEYCLGYRADMILSTDGQTDGQTDGHGDTNIAPFLFKA